MREYLVAQARTSGRACALLGRLRRCEKTDSDPHNPGGAARMMAIRAATLMWVPSSPHGRSAAAP
eukprot:364964-Chlamydomonas_euryale.AAC.11